MANIGILTEEGKLVAVLGFLWLANLSTIPAMVPLLHETYESPDKEHSVPWIVWTVAYLFLIASTVLSDHESLAVFWALMAYPVINVVLHGLVAWWAAKQPLAA